MILSHVSGITQLAQNVKRYLIRVKSFIKYCLTRIKSMLVRFLKYLYVSIQQRFFQHRVELRAIETQRSSATRGVHED